MKLFRFSPKLKLFLVKEFNFKCKYNFNKSNLEHVELKLKEKKRGKKYNCCMEQSYKQKTS